MTEDFEKLDKEWMEKLKDFRQAEVPPAVRKDFAADVVRRIQENRKAGPGFGLAYAGIGIFVLAALAGLWFMVRPVPSPAPAVSPAPASVSAPAPMAAPAPAAVSIPEPPKPAAAPKVKAGLKDEDIFAEIEALRELGAWSEEDEEAIGIPAESIFSELELADQDFKPKTGAGNDIMQAKGEMYGNS